MNNNRICFLSNVSLTYLYHGIAQELIKLDSNIKIYWIVFNRFYYNYLSEKYPNKNILLINKTFIYANNPIIGEFKINELIYSDRAWRFDRNNAKLFLSNIQKPIYDFIKNNKISFIFGETTWAHEILISRICNSGLLNVKYLSPHPLRIPSYRFAFFSDEFLSKITYNKNKNKFTQEEFHVNQLKKNAKNYNETIDNIKKQKKSSRYYLKKLFSFLLKKNRDKLDPGYNGFSRLKSLKTNVIILKNRIGYKLIKRVRLDDLDTFNKIVFIYAFHKQPETSIDVKGRYYDNQYLNVINIYRNMPTNGILLLKEHELSIGDRSYRFYKKLLKLNDVFLISENTNLNELFNKTNFVFTVSGTMAYEFALKSKHSFTFANTFFNIHKNSHRISVEELRNNQSPLIEIEEDGLDTDNYFEIIKLKSYPGIIEDPISNDNVLNESNLILLAHSFLDLINKYNV